MKGRTLLEMLKSISEQLKEFINEGRIVEKDINSEFRDQFSLIGEVFWSEELCTITWACKCSLGLDSIEIVLEKLKELLKDTNLEYSHTQVEGGDIAWKVFVKFYLKDTQPLYG